MSVRRFLLFAILILLAPLLLFVLVFAPVLLLGAFLPILTIAVGTAFAANSRRVRQGHLLWLLAIAVDKRLPLPEEIEAHSLNLRGNTRFRTRQLAQLLRDGTPLAEALEQLPGLVPRDAVLAAQAGYEADGLAQALREAAIRHTTALDRSPGIDSPTWFFGYLGMLLTIAGGLVAFEMVFIVPKFKNIFEDFGVELPGVTQALIQISEMILGDLFVFLLIASVPMAALGVAGIGCYLGWREVRMDWLTRWFPRFDTPGILRNLSLTISSGRPLSDGIEQLSLRHHRRHIRDRMRRVDTAVERGEDAWSALREEGVVNRRELAVLRAAARVGNLSWALRGLANNIDSRQRHRLLWCFDILQPVVVLGAGLMVLFIVAAFFMPLLKLINDLA